MDKLLSFLKSHKGIVIICLVAFCLLIAGLFVRRKEAPEYLQQPAFQRNYPNFAQPGQYTIMAPYMQQIASQSLNLPIGVTLVGRGTVVSVVPGSSAARAGIQVGDVINRINGQ